MSWRDLDESDVRIRPGRKGSRPRSKDRPAHLDAVTGRVVGVDRGRYTCLLPADGAIAERFVVAMKARELGRSSIVVGDSVALVGDTSGTPDTLARIVKVHPRTSALRRSADDVDGAERVIVANADQLVIVTALANPEPRPRMVDRCLVAAYDAGMEPLLVLTKSDLKSADEFMASYAPLDVRAIVTSKDASDRRAGQADADEGVDFDGLDEVREALTGHWSVLVGHSGVGKSTLVNALVPGAARAIGHVNDVTGRGRHTSTSAVALALPEGGWVIDTPGVRTFGLAHLDPDRIVHHFPDLEPGTEECPRGCTHDEEECALDAYVAAGHAGPAGPSRLESLRRLLAARAEQP